MVSSENPCPVTEVEALRAKVYGQLRQVVALVAVKEFPYGVEHEVRIRKASKLFGDFV